MLGEPAVPTALAPRPELGEQRAEGPAEVGHWGVLQGNWEGAPSTRCVGTAKAVLQARRTEGQLGRGHWAALLSAALRTGGRRCAQA